MLPSDSGVLPGLSCRFQSNRIRVAPKWHVMTGSHDDTAFDRWRDALLEALDSPDAIMAWQDHRYQFAHELGELLAGAGDPDIAPITGHAVYGIYVAGGGPLYVGQTANARRRLRDLPVGESHHLAVTVPPEVWERVLVIAWPSLLAAVSAEEAQAAEQLGYARCGLALEYLLQITYRPIMLARRRSTGGSWTPRHIETSRSKGAISSTRFPELFNAVQARWRALMNAQPATAQAVVYSDAGRAVTPVLLHRATS
jgi:hypothetical protein